MVQVCGCTSNIPISSKLDFRFIILVRVDTSKVAKQPIVIALHHFLHCHCISLCTANILNLESSVGMRQACPDEIVTFRCTSNGSSATWVDVPSSADFPLPVDMTITLTLNATAELNGTVVKCREGNGADSLSDTLRVTGVSCCSITNTKLIEYLGAKMRSGNETSGSPVTKLGSCETLLFAVCVFQCWMVFVHNT